MPFDYSRTDRVSAQIKRNLSQIIRGKLKDPRVNMISILDVEISKDMNYAKVYFDTLDVEGVKECLEGLQRASGFLRRELGLTLTLRATPSLKFFYDDTERKANALSALIDKAVASDNTPSKD